MAEQYDHRAIEKKWQERWLDEKAFSVSNDVDGDHQYVLDMFPFLSGAGLHVGHPEGYTATDIISRYLRMKGTTVLHPMGWDSFGLPTENAAIKKGVHPHTLTAEYISTFKRQIKSIGFSYDWDREISTADPKYYKWTQWIFLQLYKRGLAYEKEAPIWWCPKDKTGLANEEVVNGKCERCGTKVEKKMLRQWILKITDYAERLLDGLNDVDWPEGIKTLQRNWIGKSAGAVVRFKIKDFSEEAEVFTTRPDTLFGTTYLVLAPEHELVSKITTPKQKKAVEKYVKSVASKSDLERTSFEKEKTGVFIGAYAVNPVNNEKIPVWIADYVLGSYGTGAIMAVPGHDQRDFAFAKKYDLPITTVVEPITGEPKENEEFRRSIVAIVQDPKTKKILTINWGQKNGGMLFIGGGREESEDPVECAKREIAEETGYTDIELLGQSEIIHHHYFAHSKKVARNIEAVGLFFKLKSKKQNKQSLEQDEQGKFTVGWTSIAEADQAVRDSLHRYVFEKFIKGICYTGEGILTNSGQFAGVSTEEARRKIVELLEKQNQAKITVHYKLRDWIFSRQRYWGEPIPLVHCESCKVNDESTKWVLNFYEKPWRALQSGEKTIETRALNPEEPHRYFGDMKEGDIIKAILKGTAETMYLRVTKSDKLKNLKDLLDHPEIVKHIGDRGVVWTMEKLKKAYDFVPDYLDRIEKNGLVAWEVEQIIPGIVPVPEKDLPVLLPDVEKYEPTGTGESPLAAIKDWMNTTCPKCGGPAKRETNTMPQWAGSCWYYLRFCDPHNDKEFASTEAMKAWLPVDMYVGGAEHAVLHLLYSRFWHKVLFDAGFIPKEVGDEPFTKLKNQGLILGPDGEKMSKSRGNVINPDEIVEKYGADTLRMYEMFMGPFEDAKPWDTNGIVGVRRFLDKVWESRLKIKGAIEVHTPVAQRRHLFVASITEGINSFKFNTCVSDLMKWSNSWKKEPFISRQEFDDFLAMLAPFAPHIAEELWSFDHETMVTVQAWPKYNISDLESVTTIITVQVNGKLRATMTMPTGSDQSAVEVAAHAEPNVQKHLTSKVLKVIFVKDKLINFVV